MVLILLCKIFHIRMLEYASSRNKSMPLPHLIRAVNKQKGELESFLSPALARFLSLIPEPNLAR